MLQVSYKWANLVNPNKIAIGSFIVDFCNTQWI